MAYSADRKPGELTALTSLATDDVFVVGDTSDASEVAKGITKSDLLTDFGATFEPLKGADDNYVTDAEKAALHAAVTVTDSAEIDLTLTGQAIQADIKTASVAKSKLDSSVQTSLGKADTASQPGHTHVAADVTDFSSAVAGNSAVTANTAKVTNATHTGDVTGATALTIASGAVTLAKMANLAQDQFIGRTTTSTGVPQTATITAAARTVLDDTTVSAMVDTLGGATATGTGGLVRATSPTLVTPVLGTPASGTVTNLTGTASININGTVGATTPTTVKATSVETTGNIELGHATDTTLSRDSAGVLAVEGVVVPTISSTSTLTNKTITSPVLTVSALGNLGTSETIDWSTATHFSGTVDQSTLTITHSNEVSGKGVTLYLTGSASSAAITFSNVDVWLDNATGAAPAVPGNGETLVVTMQYIGTTCYASATGDYSVYS